MRLLDKTSQVGRRIFQRYFTLLTPQVHTATHWFSASADAVYDAILPQEAILENFNRYRAILAVERLCGTPRSVGSQLLLRLNWGLFDLEMNESIFVADPPRTIRIRQRPLRFVPLNPRERQPPVGDAPPENYEKWFVRNFGKKPAATELQFDLVPVSNGTELTLTIQVQPERKFGKFARWLWTRRIAKHPPMIFQRIEDGIQTQ